jgi:hypothetical protein
MTPGDQMNRMARATFGNKGRSLEQASVANERQEPGEFGPVPLGEMPRRKHHDLLCIALMALTLMPVIATAEPLVTLPAPAFELPVLPPVSGTWTVMVGGGGRIQT